MKQIFLLVLSFSILQVFNKTVIFATVHILTMPPKRWKFTHTVRDLVDLVSEDDIDDSGTVDIAFIPGIDSDSGSSSDSDSKDVSNNTFLRGSYEHVKSSYTST